jgi:hypothetical protein
VPRRWSGDGWCSGLRQALIAGVEEDVAGFQVIVTEAGRFAMRMDVN